jgi:hypothetical protein
MAITNNTCIMPVAEYKNTPNAHPMSNITAMIYNSEFIVIYLNDFIDIITTLLLIGMF